MTKRAAPVVLDLASLPREQIGPFLLLGLDKTADKEQIEANWAKRLIWARKSLIKTPLEDINWAREMLNEAMQRIRADAASINLDSIGGVLRRLTQRFEGSTRPAVSQPLDEVKDLSGYEPQAARPDMDELCRSIQVPDVPQEFPIVQQLLDRWVKEPIDPWRLRISGEGENREA